MTTYNQLKYPASSIGNSSIAAGAVSPDKLDSNAQRMGFKNRIINGAMVIDQRNAGASISVSGNYVGAWSVDRFAGVKNGAGVFSLQQSSTAPSGFTNSLVATVTTADTSIAIDDFAFINQVVEGFNIADLGFGTASAKTVTLSFWVQSNLTGTYAAVIVNGTGTRSYVTNYTISVANTWEYKTVTVAGDTTGTWDKTNNAGLIIRFGLTAGTNFQQAAGSWGTANAMASSSNVNWLGTVGNNFYITGVQLEVGTSATGFEYRQYQQELALCQRYYEKSYDYPTALGSTNTAGNWTTVSGSTYPRVVSYFKVEKRSTPTMTFYADSDGSVGNVNAWDGGTVRIAAAANIFVTNKHTCPEMNYSSALGNRASMYYNWSANAEL